MNILRKLTTGLLISLLLGSTAFAAPLNPEQKAEIALMIKNGKTSGEVATRLTAMGVNVNNPAEIQAAVAEIVAVVEPDDVSTATALLLQAVTTVAASSEGATPASVAAIVQAASAGATSGAVSAAAAANPGNPAAVQAAANAAASGASAGAIAAVTSSTNTTIASSSSAVAAAASSGASSGASSAAATANVTINTNAVVASSNASAAATLASVPTTTQPAVVTVVTEPESEAETGETDPTQVETIFRTSFTLQLSYGSFIVTFNSKDNTVSIVPGSGGGTTISSNGGAVTSLTLPNIAIAGGTRALNATQLANLATQLAVIATTANGGQVVTVPGNPITVSPSS